MKTLLQKIENTSSCKVVFTDLFNTLIHRRVHPHYTIRLWAKFVIRELGLLITSDELFAIRIDALSYLSDKYGVRTLEVPYQDLTREVYNRLVNSEALPNSSFEYFKSVFEQADFVSEVSVQFKNEAIVNDFEVLKTKGYLIYMVSDFFLPKEIMTKILDHHGMGHLFKALYVSCDIGKSKLGGAMYPFVLQQTRSKASETVMIGDDKYSDVSNSMKYEISSIHARNLKHHFRNMRITGRGDQRSFIDECGELERRCAKSQYPFSEYIIHFYFFIERLYKKSRRDNVKDLFFLAREGLYLKKLFDSYQDFSQFVGDNRIRTHYLKASRQSAHQIALKPLEEEKFANFGGIYGQMSLDQMLSWFCVPEAPKAELIAQLHVDPQQTHPELFTSPLMEELRKNPLFVEYYEKNRRQQKEAFLKYLDAFGADIQNDGLALVDVGWGGTMQECIYKFLNKQVPVTGYYIGLKAVYNIEPDTKRFGLNFSLYPSYGVSYDILKANGQLYEQLLGAPHGSTLGYRMNNGQAETIEFHEENEKYVFDNYISAVQDYMFLEFETLFYGLRSINYTQEQVQEYMTNMALRVGILTNKKRIRFINNISKGFYQNVGENKVGLDYNPKQLLVSKRSVLYKFLRSPEKVFRYLVKVKPFLYAKGLYWCSWPVNLAYYYMKFNFWVKKTWFPKKLLRS